WKKNFGSGQWDMRGFVPLDRQRAASAHLPSVMFCSRAFCHASTMTIEDSSPLALGEQGGLFPVSQTCSSHHHVMVENSSSRVDTSRSHSTLPATRAK